MLVESRRLFLTAYVTRTHLVPEPQPEGQHQKEQEESMTYSKCKFYD